MTTRARRRILPGDGCERPSHQGDGRKLAMVAPAGKHLAYRSSMDQAAGGARRPVWREIVHGRKSKTLDAGGF